MAKSKKRTRARTRNRRLLGLLTAPRTTTQAQETFYAELVISAQGKPTLINRWKTGTKAELISWARAVSINAAGNAKLNGRRSFVLTFRVRPTGFRARVASGFGAWTASQVIRADTKANLIAEASRVSPALVGLIEDL
jgi:hypothetical protein